MIVWGALLLAFGVAFAAAPISLARFTGFFRFVPYPSPPTPQQLRYFRLAGLIAAAAGVALLLVAWQ